MTAPSGAVARSPIGYDGGLTCSINVTDLQRSIAWYRDIMGFTLLYAVDEMGWCELATEVERVNIGLGVSETVTPGGTTLTFGVKDIEASRARLEGMGVAFDGPIQVIEGMVKLATFHDPDGNTLMFYQELGGQPGA